jgi:hypothetical protein
MKSSPSPVVTAGPEIAPVLKRTPLSKFRLRLDEARHGALRVKKIRSKSKRLLGNDEGARTLSPVGLAEKAHPFLFPA